MSVDGILSIVKSIMIGVIRLESEVVSEIQKKLDAAGIVYSKEAVLAPRCRVDLLTEDGIAIEVKKGKPNSNSVAAQVRRYAKSEKVSALILVSERGLVHHINEANGKRVEYVSLSANWGLTV